MHRRTFLSALLGTSVASVTAATTPEQPVEKHVDISIFMTDAVKEATSKPDTPYFATELIGTALTNALTSIPDSNNTITTTVRTETTIINEGDINPDPENPVHDWEHNLTELVPDTELATDTNLLLTSESADIAGQGHFPCTGEECTDTEHTTAIIMDADTHLANLTMNDVTGPWDLTTSEYILQVALHETGHTLGLTHDHGTGEQTTPVEVTPMLGTYIFNDTYRGSDNHYNEQLPDTNDTDTVISRSTFNNQITIHDITTT